MRVVLEPGGSARDHLVIEVAERARVTVYFAGTRHFFS